MDTQHAHAATHKQRKRAVFLARKKETAARLSKEHLEAVKPYLPDPGVRTRKEQCTVYTQQVIYEGGTEVVWAKFGRSLRSLKPFKKNDVVTQYSGIILTQEQIEELPMHERTHVLSFRGRGGGIAGLREPIPGVGQGSFANHSMQPNAFFSRETNCVLVRALVDIPVKKWITVDYGQIFLNSVRGSCHQINE
jgi:hypothetical protein